MPKTRVLFVGEASFLATGFSTYWNEVLKRIHATNELEIAELGSYTNPSDVRCRQVPWKFYPVNPDPNNKEAVNAYNSRQPTAQFGEWVFDDVCLDFKPDIVCAIRDYWMDEFILRSPFRKNFKFIWMPTIDGAPQRELWLDSYKLCDRIMTYSKWGMNLLKDTGRKDTPLVTVASPGADIETFAPIEDKARHKMSIGLPPDANIIGTVMRNQKRKLYPNLIEDFAEWLKRAKRKSKASMAQKTFLYLHTSYPDVGYDIGALIRKFKVGKHVLMTYLCRNCNTAYPSTFQGQMTLCKKCGQLKAQPPNATHSCPRNVLASIMNLFDLYVQYSICWEKGSKVWMGDGTLKPIEDIVIGDQVLTHDGKTQNVTQTFRSEPGDALKINIFGDNQDYNCTMNHPLWSEDGWKRARDFNKGDWVGFPIDKFGNKNMSIDPYILGLLTGDGWICKNGRLGISLGYNKKRAIAAIEGYLKDKTYYHRDRNSAAIEFTWEDKDLQWLKPYLCGGSKTKRLPPEIFQCTKEYVSQVLKGLFDTDGHYGSEDIRFYSSSTDLSYQVKRLLLGMNILCSNLLHRRTDKDSDEYNVIIKHKDSQELFRLITQEILSKNKPPPKTKFMKIEDGYFWSKVRSIDKTSIQGNYVYNLEVEAPEGGDASNHSYVVSWITAHNCEGW